MSEATIRKLFADQHKLRLSMQGMKTQHGYIRSRLDKLEQENADHEQRLETLERYVKYIIFYASLFLLTILVGAVLR